MIARILIVDDSPHFQSAFATLLRMRGCEVRFAASAFTALEMLREEQFDLILLDYRMPLAGGQDTLRLLRRDGCKLPVIAYTFTSPESSPAFEAAMKTLGACAAVRCVDSHLPLLQAVESVLPLSKPKSPAAPA
jgi:CheY-like chemotaxis protein